jgi:hypothetical protein
MELLDRYLMAVRIFLPRAQQDDIIRELSEDIHSQIEDREDQLGRPLTKAEQKQLIAQLGHPALLAGRYGPRRQLIGPELFPFYWLVLKLSLGANALAQTIAVLAAIAAGRSVNPGLRAFSAISALFIAFGVVTIVFAVLDRYRPSTLGRRTWDPDRLPMTAVRQHRGSHAITRLVTGVLFVFWWAASEPYPVMILGAGSDVLKFGPAWQVMHPWILVLALTSITTAGLELLRPQWERARAAIRLAASAGALIVLFVLLKAGDFVVLVNPDADAARLNGVVRVVNQSVFWTLLFVALPVLLTGLWELRAWRRRAPRGPSRPAAHVSV